MSENRLTRSGSDKIVAGVCGGLAEYLGIESVYVRLAFIVLLFASGIGIPIYILLWVVMPEGSGTAVPGNDVVQKNIDDLGETVQTGMDRIGRPGTFGIVLILLGLYFLLNEIGLLGWLGSALFWSLLLIGGGVFLLARRGSKAGE